VKAKTLIELTAILAVLTVLVVRDWSSGRAQPVASITLPPPGATEQLYPGCNNVGLTFGDGTPSGAVLDAVSPAGSVETMWRHDAAQQRWEGFSPAEAEARAAGRGLWGDCDGNITLSPLTKTTPTPLPTPNLTPTPLPTASRTPTPSPWTKGTPTPLPTASRTPTASPTPGTVSTAVAPTEVLDSFRYTMEWTMGTGADTLTITSRGEFEAGELEAPDRVHCAITMSAGGMTLPWDKVVVIPPDAWYDMGSGWTHTTPSDPIVDGDLRQFCPGSSLFWEGFLPLDLAGIPPGQVTFINGVLATRLSLKGVVQSIPILGVIPPDVTVDTFYIWVAQSGGWLVALEFDATVDGEPTRIRVDVTNPNDRTISVDPPM
jgi:hypothetical protein